jgi:hypothetical protein
MKWRDKIRHWADQPATSQDIIVAFIAMAFASVVGITLFPLAMGLFL